MPTGELDRTRTSPSVLARRFQSVRANTLELVEPLEPEDFVVQSMPDTSPTRWHLAHTTWFFETFVLREWVQGYEPVDPAYEALFNSYYNGIGQPFPRSKRGLLSRPTVAEVLEYRRVVEERVLALLRHTHAPKSFEHLAARIELGLQHEQQHQELILTDIKHVLAQNPMSPVYREPASTPAVAPPRPSGFERFEEGVRKLGFDDEERTFRFDNELPRHRTLVHSFELARRPVSNGEYLAFVEDGGYERPELWLADGWDEVQQRGWEAPLYWRRIDGRWWNFTLGGLRPVDPAEPVCHVAYYEADAFARWSDARLPTEAEWESAADGLEVEGTFADPRHAHPRALSGEARGLERMFGDAWEWTASDYVPYPGYRAPTGTIGEYNGKFMCNQRVLRGGSCATPRGHVRPTYRNFFYPHQRWQFSGIRLAR